MNPDDVRLAFARNLITFTEGTKTFTCIDLPSFQAQAAAAMPATFTAAEIALAQSGSWTPAMATKAKAAGAHAAPRTAPDTDLLFWLLGRPR